MALAQPLEGFQMCPFTKVPDRLIPPVKQYVVPVLQDAVRACVDRHQIAEGRGVDEFSIGTDLWSLPARQFNGARSDPDFPFVVSGPGCVLHLDDIHLRHCRVAKKADAEIADSFPTNARALAAEANTAQLSWFEQFDGREASEWLDGKTIAVAFCANETEGLLAVYLCTVARVEDGRVAEWGDIVEVWRSDAIGVQPSQGDYEQAPTEEVLEPEIARRSGPMTETSDK